MNNKRETNMAKAAYHAYGSVTDFKNYQGLPMPEWEMLTDKIREAWRSAALYAFNEGYAACKELDDEPDHK